MNFSEEESDCFVSAANGAVLASVLNVPLLYVSPSEVPECTKEVLYKLGVKNIYLVDVGAHLSANVKNELESIANVKENYEFPGEVYNSIKGLSGRSDVIFTTIDPWTYWYVGEGRPAGETKAALFVGPAAYIAAQHGSPVIIVDEHPRLSQAVVYHTIFWRNNAIQRYGAEPCSGSMVLSGREVYDLLEDYGFGMLEDGGPAEQIKETIITVAGQYDIGTPWDRAFTGAAYPGRFWGSPVDTAYAISRNVFYPGLIFVNPAMDKVKLINGSVSVIQRVGGRLKDPKGVSLVIVKPSGKEEFRYPVLHTYNAYGYKFNERASKHWNFKYTRADGIIPYFTDSLDPIDDGVTGKPGAYYPDMSESEVIPFYAKRAGYDNVFSTNFSAVVENLNRGVLIWVEECHGFNTNGGMISMWDPSNPYVYESNPWRAYEPIMLKPGHLRTFLHWFPYFIAEVGEALGFSESQIESLERLSSIRLLKFQLFSEKGCTENPDVALINPQLLLLNKVVGTLTGGMFELWGAFGFEIHRDRVLHPLKTLSEGLPFVTTYDGKVTISPNSGHAITMRWMTGVEFDDALENLHSCGINTISCMPALTYLHLTWMRHGTTYQIIDPWTTTDWSGTWNQMIMKRFAMGDTLGEAYEKGMRACGPEYIVGQWWWDKWENVELFGDPDLRVFVPGTEYSDANHWERSDVQPLRYDGSSSVYVDGHMPFGATSYPHEKQPLPLMTIIIVALLIIILLAGAAALAVKNKKKGKKGRKK